MTPARKAPHCRMCHKPLKGHRRGVCNDEDTTEPDPTFVKKSGGRKAAPLPDRSGTSPAPTKKPYRGKKLVSLPAESLPMLSLQPSEIHNNFLRKDPSCNEHTLYMPGALRNASVHEADNLNVALACLSVNDKDSKKTKTPSESRYTSTEVEEESSGEEEPGIAQNGATAAVSQQLGSAVESVSDNETSAFAPRTQRHISSPVARPAEATIQNFLDSATQSSQYPPATIFFFPATGVAALKEGAHSLGLYVYILPLPSTDERWVPVTVGQKGHAVKKLFEDGEKLVQAVRKSRNSSVREFRVTKGHIVAGTLGALATLVGLAYT